jgi:HlyD family secretion protein
MFLKNAQGGRRILGSARGMIVATLALAGCSPATRPPDSYPGYAEADLHFAAATQPGRITRVHVLRGQAVAMGAPLFDLEDSEQIAQLAEARGRLRQATARLANLQRGRRPDEIASIDAQVAQTSATRRLAELQLEQQEQLHRAGFISQARLDEARAAVARDRARLAQTSAERRMAAAAIGRADEVAAAASDIATQQALVDLAQWRLSERKVQARIGGVVQDTYFRVGEVVSAAQPVLSLLPAGPPKLRFFVPEAVRNAAHVGRRISATCDGCTAPLPATIRFLSPQPEFTPPVIYSREAREKLVYLAEATLDAGAAISPGQPVDVRLTP